MKRAMLYTLSSILAIIVSTSLCAKEIQLPHEIIRDGEGKTIAWYRPDIPGAAYAQVAKLASEFLKTVPIEPVSGLKLYMVHADFNGPNQNENYYKGTTGTDWMPNPACVFAGFVQGLAVDYRVFSGDESYIDLVGECLDQMLANGTTSADWSWPKCPYASADPRSKIYQGATKWEETGRGDGLHHIQPDKVGELGIAYLRFYQISEVEKYLEAAVNCADALAKHVRDVAADDDNTGFGRNYLIPNFRDFDTRSPWPFRVNAKTGEVKDEYTSNVVESVRLFDELIRIAGKTDLAAEKTKSYKKARDTAWKWLFAKNGPMKTYIWNGYFEDTPSDPKLLNRVQITPMETARYILEHPELDSNWQTNVQALIHWVASAFGTDGMDAIKEQTWCYFPMGSHTARYASICALYYEKTGEEYYKEEAYRFFNFATYMCEKNGYVWVGPDWERAWWSDGWGDYIRHFMEGLAAVPEWAPADEDHLLRSSSVVQKISYEPGRITYKTYDDNSNEVLRLTKKPTRVKTGYQNLVERSNLDLPGWTWKEMVKGGVLRVRHEGNTEVEIVM